MKIKRLDEVYTDVDFEHERDKGHTWGPGIDYDYAGRKFSDVEKTSDSYSEPKENLEEQKLNRAIIPIVNGLRSCTYDVIISNLHYGPIPADENYKNVIETIYNCHQKLDGWVKQVYGTFRESPYSEPLRFETVSNFQPYERNVEKIISLYDVIVENIKSINGSPLRSSEEFGPYVKSIQECYTAIKNWLYKYQTESFERTNNKFTKKSSKMSIKEHLDRDYMDDINFDLFYHFLYKKVSNELINKIVLSIGLIRRLNLHSINDTKFFLSIKANNEHELESKVKDVCTIINNYDREADIDVDDVLVNHIIDGEITPNCAYQSLTPIACYEFFKISEIECKLEVTFDV